MASRSLFDEIYREWRSTRYKFRSLQSTVWFRDRVRELNGKINRSSLLEDPSLKQGKRTITGRMYMFVYDPKHKATLPYYDKFPLIIMVGPHESGNGFYGINLHYLEPLTRAAFLDKLIDAFATEKSAPSLKARFRISYGALKGLSTVREFAPCFKHYLTQHVKSSFAEVQGQDWQIAMWLPTQHFAKKNSRVVWSESAKSLK